MLPFRIDGHAVNRSSVKAIVTAHMGLQRRVWAVYVLSNCCPKIMVGSPAMGHRASH